MSEVLPYRNRSIDLQSKSMDWFLYDRDLRHERVNERSISGSFDRIRKFPKLLFSALLMHDIRLYILYGQN